MWSPICEVYSPKAEEKRTQENNQITIMLENGNWENIFDIISMNTKELIVKDIDCSGFYYMNRGNCIAYIGKNKESKLILEYFCSTKTYDNEDSRKLVFKII